MTVVPTPSYTRSLNKFLLWRSAYKIVTLLGWAYEENKCSHNTCLAVLAIVPRCTLTAVTPKCIHTRDPVLTGFSFAFIYIYDGKNKVILSIKHLVCLITF